MKKALSIAGRVLTILLLIFAVFVMVFTVISVSTVGKADADFLGFKPNIVLSDSMQDTFAVGDLEVSRKVDPESLAAGDIITFRSIDPANYGSVITHKIREITHYEGGLAFVTYGTTTGVDDAYPVPADKVLGKYVFRLPKMGYFFEFLRTTAGYVTVILLPFLVLIGLQLFRFVRLARQYKAEQREELANQMLARLAGSDEFSAMLERNFAPYRRLMTYYECAMMEVETKFRVLDAEFGLQHDRNPIESIKSRLKSTDSLAKKLVRKGFPVSVDSIEKNIYDVAGVRVVCTFPEDMFSLAESLLSQDDVRLIERRDYVASPKPSGYRSLHLIVEVPIFLEREKRCVKVEVQLRTISMNFWASLEHQLRYKKDLAEEDAAAVAAELADLADTAAELDRRMQALRNYLDDGEE